MRFRIKNFGPIQDGFPQDEFMDISGVTLFIGSQGAGKSTVAKALSTMIWIEKALVRKDFTSKELQLPGRFKAHFAFHKIKSYFNADSEIEYIGSVYRIAYLGEGNLAIERLHTPEGDTIHIPKIMYVPSERNFLSVVPKPSMVNDLPPSFAVFLDEYEKAKRELTGEIGLPVAASAFSYDKLNDTSWVIRKGNKTRLSEASSGYQSIVPLYLVSSYLAKQLSQKRDQGYKEELLGDYQLSNENLVKLRKEINQLISNTNIDNNVLIAMLNNAVSTYRPSYFINIVEEPEQNLFPDSQLRIFFELLSHVNLNDKNMLIVTTHSPYLINALSLAVACRNIDINKLSEDEKVELGTIVPYASWIDPEAFLIYKLDNDGNISLLENYAGLPSDENYLNEFLGDFNDSFSRILELGDR